jgi:hypothetical protein
VTSGAGVVWVVCAAEVTAAGGESTERETAAGAGAHAVESARTPSVNRRCTCLPY